MIVIRILRSGRAFLCLTASLLYAIPAVARILPETLFYAQYEFYPIREQPRGYLGRFVDMPLEVKPELPQDPNRKGISDHPYWGCFHSQADFEEAQRLGKSYGLDGFTYFPSTTNGERLRYWTCGELSSVEGFQHVPLLCLWSGRWGDDAEMFREALRHERIPEVNGKKIILSYWSEKFNPKPEKLGEKLARVRENVGDRFLYVVDISSVSGEGGAFRKRGAHPPHYVAQEKDLLRRYLRVCDGIGVGDSFAFFKMEKNGRIFNKAQYAAALKMMKEVVDEPEFAGKKLLVTSAMICHDNATRQHYTPSQDGTRTLRDSLEVALSVDPDVVVFPEWDEYNENTCLAPTFFNGYTSRRICRHLIAKAKGRPLPPLEDEDASVPNLIVSWRKEVSPGEKFFVEVLNVPDGSSSEPIVCRVSLTDAEGGLLKRFPAFSLASDKLEDRHLFAASDELASSARAFRVCVDWVRGDRRGTVCDGLAPVEIVPGASWDTKDVKQAFRDLAPVTKADISCRDGKVSVDLGCDVPLRHVFVTVNGLVQYVHGAAGDERLFREDGEWAAFEVSPWKHQATSRTPKPSYFMTVEGAPSASWFDWKGMSTNLTQASNMLSFMGESSFLRIRKSELATACLAADFGLYLKGSVPLSAAYEKGGYVLTGQGGAQLAVSRLQRQSRIPLPLGETRCAFTAVLRPDRPSSVCCVHVVTMGGKTWRSRPFVLEASDGGMVPTVVRSAESGELRQVDLPRSRVPQLAYDFSPSGGDFLPTRDGWRHFGAVGGGFSTAVVGYNRNSGTTGTEPVFPKDVLLAPAPRHILEPNGEWSLHFDGIDDFLCFPAETIPQHSGWRLAFDLFPERDDVGETLFAARQLLCLTLEKGELVCRYSSMDELDGDFAGSPGRTGLHLAPGRWHHVEIVHCGSAIGVSVDGKSAPPIACRLPSMFISFLGFGHPWYFTGANGYFRGRLKNLVIDHSVTP